MVPSFGCLFGVVLLSERRLPRTQLVGSLGCQHRCAEVLKKVYLVSRVVVPKKMVHPKNVKASADQRAHGYASVPARGAKG